MSEKLTPDRAIRLLRAKAGELEAEFLEVESAPQSLLIADVNALRASIALVATLLADHIERSERHDEQLRQMYKFLADKVISPEARERLLEEEEFREGFDEGRPDE
jgi:hypothetical protein